LVVTDDDDLMDEFENGEPEDPEEDLEVTERDGYEEVASGFLGSGFWDEKTVALGRIGDEFYEITDGEVDELGEFAPGPDQLQRVLAESSRFRMTPGGEIAVDWGEDRNDIVDLALEYGYMPDLRDPDDLNGWVRLGYDCLRLLLEFTGDHGIQDDVYELDPTEEECAGITPLGPSPYPAAAIRLYRALDGDIDVLLDCEEPLDVLAEVLIPESLRRGVDIRQVLAERRAAASRLPQLRDRSASGIVEVERSGEFRPAAEAIRGDTRMYVITAWNPLSIELDSDENASRNAQLRTVLGDEAGVLSVDGAVVRAPDGSWAEQGFAVTIPRANRGAVNRIASIGRRFGQVGIFEVTPEGLAVIPLID
jgi:hypothetical protein